MGSEVPLHLLWPEWRHHGLPQQECKPRAGELDYLVNRWHIDSVEAVDNILDMSYFNDVLPSLREYGLRSASSMKLRRILPGNRFKCSIWRVFIESSQALRA